MMDNNIIDVEFEGFFLCRLATDPDPSLEQRGISGFTMAVAGESLLDPSIFCQPEDIEKEYGLKDSQYMVNEDAKGQFKIKNIRQASPDYEVYNKNGIGLKVKNVKVRGEDSVVLNQRLCGSKVRFTAQGVPDHVHKGPIFEGRNQIVSDGDPDRFTVNPFVFEICDDHDDTLLRRFDPLDFDNPKRPLWEIVPVGDDKDIVERRLPCQRFPTSQKLLDRLKISDAAEHFVNRGQWLKEKIAEAEALGKYALAESYRSRLFGVDFFTQATGPTVLENRLASRIPLRQLYRHTIRGTMGMDPVPVVDSRAFDPGDLGAELMIDIDQPWDAEYYIGAYDGDLMNGFISGTVSLPFQLKN